MTARAQLAPIEVGRPQIVGVQSLRLEVFINGAPTHLVEPFDLAPDHHLSARRIDLEEIGIKVSGFQDPRGSVDLASLPRVIYSFDEPHQRIDFHVRDEERLDRVYDARGERLRAPSATADWGTLLNYSLYGTTMSRLGTVPQFSGLNASLDARGFSPYGELSQTAIVGDTITTRENYLRLDSTYSYSDPDLTLTGRVGDTISGGLVWTRPIRFAGLQLQRDFGLRSDLVVQPLPNISGSAAVPSTVDVFVDNVKTFSQDVSAGPYNITNLPVVSGSGTAHVVVTDATGRQTETSLPFFTTPTLLAKGLTDFSLDAGFARRNYGLLSYDYDRHPLGSATGRHGLTDWLTLEGHGEGGAGLMNGGFGAVARVGRWGVVSLALAGSHKGRAIGGQIYADYNFEYAGFTVDLSTQRTLKRYNDLASVTATNVLPVSLATTFAVGSYFFDPRPPRALDRITFGIPLHFDTASLSASFINYVQADGVKSRIVAASLSRPLPFDASFFATGFFDLDRRHGAGVFAGLSVPLGPTVRASLGGSYGDAGRFASLDVTKPLEHVDNSFGWRVRDLEGTTAIRTGDVAYRSAYATADVQVAQQGRQISTQSELDGSVGMMNTGGFFIGNRVYDSFAVIDAGLPDVPVYEDNRLIGKTNPFGKLVVSDLQSYQRNTIGIDPLALPVNADARTTKTVISAASRAGVGLNFGIDRNVNAALVAFVDASGKPLSVGSRGHLDGSDESFVVGYDGQTYVKHLAANDRAVIDLGDHDCAAAFAYLPDAGKRVTIGPVVCQ